MPVHDQEEPKHTCVVEKPRKRKRRQNYFHGDNHRKCSDVFFNHPAPVQPPSFWKMSGKY